MREMLLAAALCAALGLAITSLRMTGDNADLAAPPNADAEVKAMMTMMGAPYVVIDERSGAGVRLRKRQDGSEGEH